MKPILNLTNFPNVLIGGTTGFGKTHFLRREIAALISTKTPDELKLVICASKPVDYDIIVDARQYFCTVNEAEAYLSSNQELNTVVSALSAECDRRLALFRTVKCYSVETYNDSIANSVQDGLSEGQLPHILLVFDDLTTFLNDEIIQHLSLLTSKNRSTGISVLAVTSQINSALISNALKANFNLRLAFKVMSTSDSKKVLGIDGAEKLSKAGEYLSSESGKAVLTVEEASFESLEGLISDRKKLITTVAVELGILREAFDPDDLDSLFEEAARLIVMHQQGSTSLIQRKLKLGYNRAGRLMDQMEAVGVVGPFEGSKAREVLLPDDYALEQFLDNLNFNAGKQKMPSEFERLVREPSVPVALSLALEIHLEDEMRQKEDDIPASMKPQETAQENNSLWGRIRRKFLKVPKTGALSVDSLPKSNLIFSINQDSVRLVIPSIPTYPCIRLSCGQCFYHLIGGMVRTPTESRINLGLGHYNGMGSSYMHRNSCYRYMFSNF